MRWATNTFKPKLFHTELTRVVALKIPEELQYRANQEYEALWPFVEHNGRVSWSYPRDHAYALVFDRLLEIAQGLAYTPNYQIPDYLSVEYSDHDTKNLCHVLAGVILRESKTPAIVTLGKSMSQVCVDIWHIQLVIKPRRNLLVGSHNG